MKRILGVSADAAGKLARVLLAAVLACGLLLLAAPAWAEEPGQQGQDLPGVSALEDAPESDSQEQGGASQSISEVDGAEPDEGDAIVNESQEGSNIALTPSQEPESVEDVPAGTLTPLASYTIDVSAGASSGTGYVWDATTKVITFTADANSHSYTFIRTGGQNVLGIVLASGVDTTIVLQNLTLSTTLSCIKLEGSAKLTLSSVGTSKLESSDGAGIEVTENATLTLQGSGSLEAKGGLFGAGIGGGNGGNGGTITIEGGTITATGGGGAGIGGGRYGNGGIITITGGTVTATGRGGAGIGGADTGSNNSGLNGNGGIITITGGTVTATGDSASAGIGGSWYGDGGIITITDGIVIATASGGAGIGGGWFGNGGTITITGGTVTATSTYSGACIGGGGWGGNGGTITITGGTVNATGASVGAGIGGGNGGNGGTITIEGGTITATGNGAGIGGGHGGIITITGGTVTATGRNGAGIGGTSGGGNPSGLSGNGGTITITGGTVIATGSGDGAGIGGSGEWIGDPSTSISIAPAAKVTALAESSDTPAIDASSGNEGLAHLVAGSLNAATPYDRTLAYHANGGAELSDQFILPANYASFAYTTGSTTQRSDRILAYRTSDDAYLGRIVHASDSSLDITSTRNAVPVALRIAADTPTLPPFTGKAVTLSTALAGGRNIDIPGRSTKQGEQAIIWSDTVGANQRFYVGDAGGGAVYLQNVNSGLVLDINGANISKGAAIIQWPYKGSDNQKWYIEEGAGGSGTYVITSALNPSYCLDIFGGQNTNGAKLILWERTGGANQSWDIAPITPSLADGTYTICTAGAGNRSLDVEGASLQDGARMLLWDFHGQTNQQFTIHFLPETGYYTIVGLASQKSVDVFGNSTASGTQIIQWTLHGQLNQQWSIADSGAGNGTLAIIGARNNLSLDVFGGNVSNNGRIIAWPYHGQYNQQWLFDAVG